MTWYAHAEGKPQTAHDSEEAAQAAAKGLGLQAVVWEADDEGEK